ncbi:MAG: hypothetical protein DRO88_00650 [Promethearchaeia archaeon]|nr:MAG: hypothetical protein DRO88_00650 [Candidatus Lokiarchaeia archaeon]
MVFDVKDLVDYISTDIIPPEAMIQLNKLLFKELHEYCMVCEDDRMVCVLSPQCPKRILLKVRLQAGANYEDLPKFCYSQAVNNIKRYLNKNTTLYTPQDEPIFNNDFIEIMFPKMQKKFNQYFNKEPSKLHEIISKSKIPAVNLDFRYGDRAIFDRIISKDKVIKEGTFLYDIVGPLMIIWFEGAIFISDFTTNLTIVNAKDDIIVNLRIIDIVFHTYCAEMDIEGITIVSGEHQITLIMKIPFNQVSPDYLQEDSTFFLEFFEFLQQNYFEIELAEDERKNLTITLKYQNLNHFLKQNNLQFLTYGQIRQLLTYVNNLRQKVPLNSQNNST